MENELLDLADRLCTVAGMIMEDNNLLAVSTTYDAIARQSKLDTLTAAADDMAVLIAAAKALVRLG
jgi:hypothetical protein